MSNHCTIYAEMHLIFDNDFDVHSITKQLGIAPTECKLRDETRNLHSVGALPNCSDRM